MSEKPSLPGIYPEHFSELLNDLRDEDGYREDFPTAEEVDDSICFFVADDMFHHSTDDELRERLIIDNPEMFGVYQD